MQCHAQPDGPAPVRKSQLRQDGAGSVGAGEKAAKVTRATKATKATKASAIGYHALSRFVMER